MVCHHIYIYIYIYEYTSKIFAYKSKKAIFFIYYKLYLLLIFFCFAQYFIILFIIGTLSSMLHKHETKCVLTIATVLLILISHMLVWSLYILAIGTDALIIFTVKDGYIKLIALLITFKIYKYEFLSSQFSTTIQLSISEFFILEIREKIFKMSNKIIKKMTNK